MILELIDMLVEQELKSNLNLMEEVVNGIRENSSSIYKVFVPVGEQKVAFRKMKSKS